MAQFHFVEDYERHVANLVATHPLDEAMSLAVGGHYERFGAIEAALLRHAGLADGQVIADLGCGSGRLAHALGRRMSVSYTGIDIVQALLDYARTRAPAGYRFLLHRALSLPLPDASQDFVVAFSVFTHLLHAETYLYLEDARRVLRPSGRVVFSFLEFDCPAHWAIFEGTLAAQRDAIAAPINTFIERSAIEVWSRQLRLKCDKFIRGDEAHWAEGPFGQTMVILSKPL